jgi:hypothetical protein
VAEACAPADRRVTANDIPITAPVIKAAINGLFVQRFIFMIVRQG